MLPGKLDQPDEDVLDVAVDLFHDLRHLHGLGRVLDVLGGGSVVHVLTGLPSHASCSALRMATSEWPVCRIPSRSPTRSTPSTRAAADMASEIGRAHV